MANWWEELAGGIAEGARPAAKGFQDFVGSLPQRAAVTGINALRMIPGGAPFFAGTQIFGKSPKPTASTNTAGQRFGGADKYAGLMDNVPAPVDSGAMSDEEMLAFLLGGSGGGGGVDLSGYNTMLDALTQREGQITSRRDRQAKFLEDLFNAAEARAMSDRDALAAAVESQLANDAARRSTEIGLIRGADADRLRTSEAARQALGAEVTGADIASGVAQNAVAGVGSSGSVADRDARINEAIARQQLTAEISGLTPMEQMARGQLETSYEDRLAQLAGERAAIQAQIAQARASARGSGGPSVGEKLAALEFIQGRNAGPELPEAIGGQSILNTFIANDPRNTSKYAQIYNSIGPLLQSYAINPTTGKMMDPTELANSITASNPDLINSGAARDFLQQLILASVGK